MNPCTQKSGKYWSATGGGSKGQGRRQGQRSPGNRKSLLILGLEGAYPFAFNSLFPETTMNKPLHLLTLSLTITALALTASQCNRPKTLPSIAENKSAFQKTVFTQDQTGEIHAEVERQMGSFALIPAGNFIMGDSFDGESNAPTHTVNVSAFSMAKNLVTKELWDNVRTRSLPHGYDLGAGWGKAANHPVQGITWYDAAKWCNACSEMTGL